MGNVTVITTPFIEKGTAVFRISFYDESSQAVAPNSVYYTLTDVAGNVINSLDNVGLSNPAASMHIVLSNNDLMISSGFNLEYERRHLLVSGNYNSSIGSGLSIRHLIKFDVTNPGLVL